MSEINNESLTRLDFPLSSEFVEKIQALEQAWVDDFKELDVLYIRERGRNRHEIKNIENQYRDFLERKRQAENAIEDKVKKINEEVNARIKDIQIKINDERIKELNNKIKVARLLSIGIGGVLILLILPIPILFLAIYVGLVIYKREYVWYKLDDFFRENHKIFFPNLRYNETLDPKFENKKIKSLKESRREDIVKLRKDWEGLSYTQKCLLVPETQEEEIKKREACLLKAQEETDEMLHSLLEESLDKEHNLNQAINEILKKFDQYNQLAILNEDNYDPSKTQSTLLPGMRIGSKRFSGKKLVKNEEGEIISQAFDYSVPALSTFLSSKNFTITMNDKSSADTALKIVHNLVARSLASIPGGKLLMTFIDPIGLGNNVAPFLKLDEELYGGKVWVDSNHINDQLTNLSRHIENVIQKYLRDEFRDITFYNEKAQEVEEPYRLLVVTNFPAGFDEQSASRLRSIMQNGPKAGVFTILTIDRDKKFPYNTSADDFKINAFELITSQNENTGDVQLVIEADSKHAQYTLVPDTVAPISEIVQDVNKRAAALDDVKVDFRKGLLDEAKWWQADCDKELRVPIGKSGAQNLQEFSIDNKNTPHALLVGMSGSGKSNLLHVLLTHSVTKYSPDQLEIYLVDFKGGVEFTSYAEKAVPHVRTIAIESDREFGLSVLHGLENEMLRRETEFRNKHVTNLKEYHAKMPEEHMPRILFIADEFQEFFSEDDKISNKAEQIFDRVVRKGRAMGINILLATQSLAGAKLSTSIKNQIAIRIALMCSDSDSRQILSDENGEAKLLNRPGEGIYNSSQGLIEGNKRFQTFFQTKDERDELLEKVVSKAETLKYQRKTKQVIFRGDKAATLDQNMQLQQVIPSDKPRAIELWLGEPLAISNDVSATLRRQGGANVLFVGQDEQAITHVMVSALISAMTHFRQDQVTFYNLNFFNPDSKSFDTINEFFQGSPHPFNIGKSKDTKSVLKTIKEEVDKRLEDDSPYKPTIIFSLFSLQRGRRFRKEGYSLSEEGEMLQAILKDGPDVGIHSIVYIDSLKSFDRIFDHSALIEFGQRACIQISQEELGTLTGNAFGKIKLGSNRGLYFDEIEGDVQKFKPYNLPSHAWVGRKIFSKIN